MKKEEHDIIFTWNQYISKSNKFIKVQKYYNWIKHIWLVPFTITICLLLMQSKIYDHTYYTFYEHYRIPCIWIFGIVTAVLFITELVTFVYHVHIKNYLNKVTIIEWLENGKLNLAWLFGIDGPKMLKEPWYIDNSSIVTEVAVTYTDEINDQDVIRIKNEFFNDMYEKISINKPKKVEKN